MRKSKVKINGRVFVVRKRPFGDRWTVKMKGRDVSTYAIERRGTKFFGGRNVWLGKVDKWQITATVETFGGAVQSVAKMAVREGKDLEAHAKSVNAARAQARKWMNEHA